MQDSHDRYIKIPHVSTNNAPDICLRQNEYEGATYDYFVLPTSHAIDSFSGWRYMHQRSMRMSDSSYRVETALNFICALEGLQTYGLRKYFNFLSGTPEALIESIEFSSPLSPFGPTNLDQSPSSPQERKTRRSNRASPRSQSRLATWKFLP